MSREPKWAAQPTPDDVADATRYLTLLDVPGPLIVDPDAPRIHPAKDLLRASGLPVLPESNAGVRKWRDRLRKGAEIPPVLLVVGSIVNGYPMTIAEGYHRVCAAYLEDEVTPVRCFLLRGGSPS